MKTFDCTDIKALLSGLVDGEVDVPTRHLAERHLSQCAQCRDAVSEAERMNDAVALEAQRQLWPAGLPEGFEAAVLRRTVYAEAFQLAGRRWTSWLGWVAAAACLLLALSIWVLDRQLSSIRSSPLAHTVAPQHTEPAAATYPVNARSWVSETGLPADAFAIRPADGTRGAAALRDLGRRPSVSREDAEAFYAASTLLSMLAGADLDSFADVERIRQIVEYDDVLPRLASARTRLGPDDAMRVFAAESILTRIAQGPLDLDDVRSMHTSVAALDLQRQLTAMSDRWQPDSSL